VTSMADGRCSDAVRFGGDLGLAPGHLQDSLAAHPAKCRDCASYVSQIATTRELLGRHSDRGGVQSKLADGAVPVAGESPTTDAEALRSALLTRAELLDPVNAEDLAQRSREVGLALQRRDSRPRGIVELTRIMHTLSDARMRVDGCTTPAVDVTAAARARADSLEDLDSDADEPELFYPDLYPCQDRLDGWVDSPNQWRGGAQILGPEEVDETGEVYDLLDKQSANCFSRSSIYRATRWPAQRMRSASTSSRQQPPWQAPGTTSAAVSTSTCMVPSRQRRVYPGELREPIWRPTPGAAPSRHERSHTHPALLSQCTSSE
jgi:hypothetical protein